LATATAPRAVGAAIDWTPSPRFARVRAAIEERARQPHQSPSARNWTRAFFELYADLRLRERQARSFAYALVNEPVRIFPAERLAGTIYQVCTGSGSPQIGGAGQGACWDEFTVAPYASRLVTERVPENHALCGDEGGAFLVGDGGAPGHIGWRWERVLQRGVLALRDDARRAFAEATDDEARDFYLGVDIAWEAMLEWNARHVAAIQDRLAARPLDERDDLAKMLAICQRVPAEPARSFREALQAYHFQHLCVLFENPYGGNGPGRLDYLLWPYLERDLRAGVLDLDEARELVAELLLKFHERLHPADGWVESVVVGGVDRDGRWAGNPLSRLIVEAFMAMPHTHPAVYVRIAESAPQDYLDLTADYLLRGGNRAQVLNDDAILPAMTATGMPFEDASDYMCGGCMEISPQGMNSDMLFTFMYNVPKTVELVLTGGTCLITSKRRVALNRDLTGFADFEALYSAYEAEMHRELQIVFRRLDCWSEAFGMYRPGFLISSLIDDCMARGRAMHDGGARYHDYAGAPVGIPNAGDILFAVRRAIFEDRRCTAAELLDALRADFAGYDDLRAYLLALPKFGCEHLDADAMTDRVLRSVCAAFGAYRNRHGGRVKPMVFNFVWTPLCGSALGASPDGRKAGQYVAHGLTPQVAGMKNGITAAINSSTALTLRDVCGGSTTMWDLAPDWANHATIRAGLGAFLARGGHIFQGNMTPVEDMVRAMDHPEDYPNLTVRVGGFSARFVTLDRELQEEIVRRYRHRG
jgi:trans-4-hydroxy-L-proline dehydratase